jgi:hypothetical protein
MFHQKIELMLELEMNNKKNQEMQKNIAVQKIQIEQLLKQCSRHEHPNCQQSDEILELKDQVDDLLSSMQVSSTCHCSSL